VTGICTTCGKDYSVPSHRGSKLSERRSPCCGAAMKGPPRKPFGMPYSMWRGSYAEREELARRWKAGLPLS
jgi:hypothetical protein